MKKRTFLKILGNTTLAMASGGTMSLLSSCGNNEPPKKIEKPIKVTPPKPITFDNKNWVWFHPNVKRSADYWKKKFEEIKATGIDALIPQVYNGVEALFEHPHPDIEIKDNWLEKAIGWAHEAGLEIHAWMWTMPCRNPKIMKAHPDWYAVNRLGESAHDKPAYVPYYNFLCPCHPDVQTFVEGNVKALAQIDGLDGVHLDYVRMPDAILAEGLQPKYKIVQDKEYPPYDYSYSASCREQFKAKTGIDPMDLEAPDENQVWRQFRYDAVTNLVNGKLVPAAKAGNKKITAAVFPNWESVRQQWQQWDLDGFLPMLYHGFYNKDIAWIGEQVQKNRKLLKSPKPIYSGLFVPNLNPKELEKAIKTSMDSGANGISIFSLESMKKAHWPSLKSSLVG